MQTHEPYRPRAVRFLELWQPMDWQIKVYGITSNGQPPSIRLVEAARRLGARSLSVAPAGHYSVGFLGVHAGPASDAAFIAWWAHENELHLQAYTGPSGAPGHLQPTPPGGPIGSAWDLALVGFERQAWVDAVLDNPHGSPDLEEYLRRRLNASL